MSPRQILLALIVAPFGLAIVSAHAATIQIVMEKLGYVPAEAQAKVGDTIEWINKDILAHTATATGGDWNYCKYHPNMKGRLTVAP